MSITVTVPTDTALRDAAIRAAHTVGEPLKEAFRTSMDFLTKSSVRDLVTIHDQQTEERLIKLLSEAVPDSRFTGEETGQSGTGTVEWIIDPIDGTSNFIHGFPLFSISIAAAVDNIIVAGVVYDPFNSMTFSADSNGAYLRQITNGDIVETKLAAYVNQTDEHQLSLLTNFPSADMLTTSPEPAKQAFSDLVTAYSQVRRVASAALEICYVAAGWSDIALGVSVNPWDIGAAQLILQRAGGQYLPFGSRQENHWDGTETPDCHLAPGYLATAENVDAPTALEVARQFAAQV